MAAETTDSAAETPRKHPKMPDDFPDAQEFLRDMREKYSNAYNANYLNLQAQIEDTAFAAGVQWDPMTLARRMSRRKPVMTFNKLLAFLSLVIGTRRMNETCIKVLPDNGGTKATARLRQGLIHSIEKNSRAHVAYDGSLQQSAMGGIGNFRILADYAGYDVFTQDLKVDALPDFTCVTWDELSNDPTGRDSRHVFVEDRMARTAFKKTWPWATAGDIGGQFLPSNQVIGPEWWSNDQVKVVSYWRMRSEKRTVALMIDGRTEDVTGKAPAQYLQQVASHPTTGEPYIREADRPYAEMYLCTASDVLAGPYRLNTYRVPVFRVPGWEINVAGSKQVFGLVRFLKDPQRLYNFWRSTIAEKLMQAPKAQWVATKKSMKGGLEEKWRNSHLSDDNLLIWNDEDTDKEPKPVPPAQMEPALAQEVLQLSQDMRDISNLHEASLGQTSNEVSGKAITARQKVGELGTVIYHDNLNMAIEEAGRVLNDLIPYFYDSMRTVKILGEDGKADLVTINNPDDPESDITAGKYSVSVITGPSYATKRQEAVEAMLSMQNANPEAFAAAADLMVENMDWPGADAIAKRLKKSNPIAAAEIDPESLTPQERQAMAQQQEAQAKQSAIAEENAMLVNQKLHSEADAASARAEQSRGAAKVAFIQAQIALKEAGKTDAEIQEILAGIGKTVAETDKIRAETDRTHAETGRTHTESVLNEAQTDSLRVNDVLEAQRVQIEKEKPKEKPASAPRK